jgi:hypothetical protein
MYTLPLGATFSISPLPVDEDEKLPTTARARWMKSVLPWRMLHEHGNAPLAWKYMDRDRAINSLIARHWQASQDGDEDAEHDIYAPSAMLDYPQSGERFRGRDTIQAQRGSHPAERRFAVRRISGHADLWVSECVITYDGSPTYSVSIMEFENEHVVRETQYFADPFAPAPGRARLAERIPEIGQ